VQQLFLFLLHQPLTHLPASRHECHICFCPYAATVLSAVSGLQVKAGLSKDAVIGLTCAILVVLFMVQSYGTQRVGVVFAPVVLLWFLSNVLVAIYNIHAYEGAAVFRAVSPHYVGKRGSQGKCARAGSNVCFV
jgi:KUP system potassium uptake protein